MAGLADSNWLRIAVYVAVALGAFGAGRREQRDHNRSPASWPTFWFLTGGLLLVMALGRAIEVGDLAGDALRDSARENGWYESRRPLQAAVVGVIGVSWLAVVVGAVWKIPDRRRRYLPMIVVVVTIGVFAMIRVVSLHQVDALLHRRQVVGARIGTVIEITLLAIAAACTAWTVRHRFGLASRNAVPAATGRSPS